MKASLADNCSNRKKEPRPQAVDFFLETPLTRQIARFSAVMLYVITGLAEITLMIYSYQMERITRRARKSLRRK